MIKQSSSTPTTGTQAVETTSDDATWARCKLDALLFRSAIDAAVALMWITECADGMPPISRK